jgi:hypothetical protein
MKLPLAWLVAAWLGLAGGGAARADTWTNLAGQTVTAKLVALEGDQVLLQQTNGHTLHVPLSSLKPTDRARARKNAGIDQQVPAALQALLDQAQTDIQRAAQFLAGGKITREEYAVRCVTIKHRFEYLGREALKEIGMSPTSANLDRLARRLDQFGSKTAAP